MLDGEWTLTHSGGSVSFGRIDQDAFLTAFPELGDAELITDDAGRPRTDGTAFGQDYRGGRTITFDLRAMDDTEEGVRGAVRALGRVWRADGMRSTPGAFAELKTRQGNRERVTFGRPRRWAVSDALANRGVISILCDFATSDDLWYDAVPTSYTLGLAPAAGGGFTSPFKSPFRSTTTSDRSLKLQVLGDVAAWPVINIAGPTSGTLTNPKVGIPGLWEIALNTSIGAGQVVTIDTQPWSRGVKRGSTNLSSSLGRTSIRLAKASIPPGEYEFYFKGTDPSGTSTVAITWRDAFTTL